MDIEEYIEKIINNGKIEDMEKLSDMLEDTMEIVKEYNKDCFEEYKLKLYKMAYGNRLNKEMAKKIVYNMKPYGEKWNYNEVKLFQEERGLTHISTCDMYTVLNSAYNDYNDIFGENIDEYIRFAIDFIEDEDAKEDKVFLYYTIIPL